jgi:hypothetical protein
MTCNTLRSSLSGSLAIVALLSSLSAGISAQGTAVQGLAAHSSAVLVELFTSEGCSDCPPADALLQQVNGQKTAEGQVIVGISEHVSYWNSLGWKDPFSSDVYSERQNDYSSHFGLSSIYTPQMVVNGREQFVGSDRRALEVALAAESQRKQITLHIDSVKLAPDSITFTYSASDLPAKGSLQLVAVLVDDVDRSNVLRGENSGRELTHVAVARALTSLGALHDAEQRQVTLPLPPSFHSNAGVGHHLVLFAQQNGTGAVMGTDTKQI